MPIVLHIDINSYFATMLQQKYPQYRGKPVGIIKDVGRTAIIAASKEAKALGINKVTTTSEARKIIPDLILLPAEFGFYLDTTKKLKSIFESISPHVQIFSLDEAFVDITDCQKHLYPNPEDLAKNIQDQIKNRLGEWVTCNIGIAKNRFLAKLAAEVSPKGSVITVTADNIDDFLNTSDFGSVCGIGLRLEKRLKSIGVTNLYSINFIDDQTLIDHFGPFWSTQLRRMGRGDEPHLFSTIDKNPYMKSIGRSITGWQLENNESHIKQILYNLTEEVVYKLRKQNLAGRQVSISLTGENQYWHQHLTSKLYLNHTQEMFNLTYHQLYKNWQRNFKVIRFAIRISLLKPLSQLSISCLPHHHQKEKLHTALDQIWEKHGYLSTTSALLYQGNPIIKPEVTGFLGDKTYQLEH